jgi:hypothetical protein
MIQPGKHKAKAIEFGIGKANTGMHQIGILFELSETKETITWYGHFSDAAYPYTVKAMRTCGWEGCDLTDLNDLKRNEVILVVDFEEYQGKQALKVKFINSIGSIAMSESIEGADLISFANQMKGKILGLNLNSKPKPRPKLSTDDDVPF